MAAEIEKAKRRLRKRIAACAYTPLPPELADIELLLTELESLERMRGRIWAAASQGFDHLQIERRPNA